MKSTTALFLWLLIALAACDDGSDRHRLPHERVTTSSSSIDIQELSDPTIFPETTAIKSMITKDGKPVYTSMTTYPQQLTAPSLSVIPGNPLDTGQMSVFNQQVLKDLELSPGQYVFKTWAADMDNHWVETANFTFTIRPPWWHFAACILVFLLSIWSYTQWRTYALRKRSRELETLVNQRTEELRLAKVAAEAANDAKSSFLSTISHELRTPLTSIIGFSKLNRKYLGQSLPDLVIPDAKTQKKIQKIDTNLQVVVSESERILSLINGLLDLAKIESGAMEWKMEEMDAGKLIERAAAAATALFEQKPQVKLIKEIPENLPVTAADHDRILQVLINLISNAVKFTDAGAVTVSVQLSPLNCEHYKESFSYYGWGIENNSRKMKNKVGIDGSRNALISPLSMPAPSQTDTAVMAPRGDSNRELIISVQDTGAGIPLKYLDRIFEKFKQVDQDQTDKPKGTGLGLPICKEIVEHHGGRIWVNSLPGHGSTFAFTLPVD